MAASCRHDGEGPRTPLTRQGRAFTARSGTQRARRPLRPEPAPPLGVWPGIPVSISQRPGRPHGADAGRAPPIVGGSSLAATAWAGLESSLADGHDEPHPGVDEHHRVGRFHSWLTWGRACRRHPRAGRHRQGDRPRQRADRGDLVAVTDVSQHGFADGPARQCPHRGPLSCLLAHHGRTRRRLQPDPGLGQGGGTYRAEHRASQRVHLLRQPLDVPPPPLSATPGGMPGRRRQASPV